METLIAERRRGNERVGQRACLVGLLVLGQVDLVLLLEGGRLLLVRFLGRLAQGIPLLSEFLRQVSRRGPRVLLLGGLAVVGIEDEVRRDGALGLVGVLGLLSTPVSRLAKAWEMLSALTWCGPRRGCTTPSP